MANPFKTFQMKKVILYSSLGLGIFIFINIVKIGMVDFDRLTKYGYGYLTGKVILFLVTMGILIKLKTIKSEY